MSEYNKSSVLQRKIHNVCHLGKITRRTKKQEKMSHTQEKNQPIETDPEMTEVMESADEELNASIVNCEDVEENMLGRDMKVPYFIKNQRHGS